MGRRGRRYEQKSKLNVKKVIAVIIAIAVVIMFVIAIKTLLTRKLCRNTNKRNKLLSSIYK